MRKYTAAYELLASLGALICIRPETLSGCRVVHFIDSTSAMACVVRAFLRQHDLSLIVDRLWYEAAVMMLEYIVQYVPTRCNLADGPSRDDMALLENMGIEEIVFSQFPSFFAGFGNWMGSVENVGRLIL